MEKILLYVEGLGKKNMILYTDDKSLIEMTAPEEFIDNGVIKNVGEIKERWQVNKVTKTNNKLTLEFKLILRKTS